MSARGQRPEVRVAELQFSPTGRDFAATTTEGLLIYSLDSKLVFDPFELNVDITPTTIRAAVKREDYGAALVMSLRLNETDLVREVVEQVPHADIDLLATDLPEKYVKRLLKFLGGELERSRHLHFYAIWCHSLVTRHSSWIRQRTGELMPVLNLLHKNLLGKSQEMSGIVERNLHTMKFLLAMAGIKRASIAAAQERGDQAMDGVDDAGREDDEAAEDDSDADIAMQSNWDSD